MKDVGSIPTEPKSKRKKPPENLEAIQADVASFAASLGLASAAAAGPSSAGFDDSDFRKKGPIRKAKKAGEQDKKKSELGSVKEKRKGKKNEATEHLPAPGGSKPHSGSKKKRDGPQEEEDAVKPRNEKGGKSGDGVKVDGRSKGNKPVPGSSKIHEVLDGGVLGMEFPNTKKRKGSWQGEENAAGVQPQKRSFSEGIESDSLKKLRAEAEQLMEKNALDFEHSRRHDSDTRWLMTARRSGTSADKVAAMTVILQENPKANVRTLDALIGMLTSNAGKRHAATGIEALKELFMFSLLPDRKLKYFSQQPVATLPETKERASLLLEWYWEDCLKQRYERFVLALEAATKDTLPFLKEKALKTVYELLKSKPEQERRLLASLVNKLGDPDRKMASNASYLLSCLLSVHPNMKKVVVDEVDAFVFRPHVGLRARYYAAVFLNQIILSNKWNGPKLAKQLIDLYFSLFKAVTSVGEEKESSKKKKRDSGKKKGSKHEKLEEHAGDFTMEIDSRLLSALLTGVNRALPYIAADDLDAVTQENSVLFRLVHSTNFNVAVQALMLLHQLLSKSEAVSDRFYRALYSVLLSQGLVKSSKAEMFLGLVFKALKSDVDPRRISAFAKRLTQVAVHQPPNFACGCLLLISEILKARPSLWNSVLQPEIHDDEEHFEDAKDETDDKIVEPSPDSNGTEHVGTKKDLYDPKHRDPLYCNAHRACWWELSLLSGHVHPSVAAMARTLLSGANILYDGDPLDDLALGVFLERFAEKKPKAPKSREAVTWHGSSMSMPSKLAQAMKSHPVGAEFASLAEDQVAPEDVVFHKFYVMKSTKKSKSKKKKRKEQDEDDVADITGLDDDGEVLEGDDSNDEEVDELLEKEADVEMDDTEGDDDSDEELVEGTADGEESEVDEFGNSEDEDADELLEAGLVMSSEEGVDEDEGTGKATKKRSILRDDVDFDEDEWTGEDPVVEALSGKKKNNKKVAAFRNLGRKASVFQEAGSDSEDLESLALSSIKRKKEIKSASRNCSIDLLDGPVFKKTGRRVKASVYQEAESVDLLTHKGRKWESREKGKRKP